MLQYVSGLSKTVAKNIVAKRRWEIHEAHGIKENPRLGAKTYEQCIGFLRILEGANPLDRTGIHQSNIKMLNCY